MDKITYEEILLNPLLLNTKFPQFNNKFVSFNDPCDFEVLLDPNHIINIIELWRAGEITSVELSKWALFILLADCYSVPTHPTDEFHYDPLLTILGKISSPKIDGEITEHIAQEYILTLKQL